MELIAAPLVAESLMSLRRRRSAKWRMYAPDVLPLTIAEMDFALAPPIRDVLHEAVERSDTGYAVDMPDLGNAISAFAHSRWGWSISSQSVRAVADVGVGTAELLRLLCRPGDSVVINPPVYASFYQWIAETGTRLVEVPLAQDDSGMWRLDLDALHDAFKQRPAVYLLCNPHNPVGRVHDFAELEAVVRMAHKYGVRIISDEVHGPLVFPGAEFTPVLTVPGAADIAFSVLSASKAWNLAGLKCAAVITAAPATRRTVMALPADSRWRTGHWGVLAAVAAFTLGEPWLNALLVTLDMRRRELGELLAEHLPEIRWQPPQATFLAWLDCRLVGHGQLPRDTFLDLGRVALEPGTWFGPQGSGYVRLNFATSSDILNDAVNRMAFALRCRSALEADA